MRPPGTGKTALARVVAAELLASGSGITVVIASTDALLHGVDHLYEELAYLAPVLVVMEDLDLVAHDRQHGSGSSLQRVLVALDGLLRQDGAIVTLATTNDLDAIDPAARRSCRFDQVVHVGLPDDRARRLILGRRLTALDVEIDLAPLVASTRGATGADLHEVVRLALLTADGDLTAEHLLAVAAEGGWRPQERVGQYLEWWQPPVRSARSSRSGESSDQMRQTGAVAARFANYCCVENRHDAGVRTRRHAGKP